MDIDVQQIKAVGRRMAQMANRAEFLLDAHTHLSQHGGPEHWTPRFQVTMKASAVAGAANAAELVQAWLNENWADIRHQLLNAVEAEAAEIAEEFRAAQGGVSP